MNEPTAQERRKACEDLIISLTESIKQCSERLESNKSVLLGQGWVVMPAMISTTYNLIIVNKTLTDVQGFNKTIEAQMFTEEDAKTLAASIKDGADRPARAMHINDALRDKIKEDTILLELTQQALAKQA